MNNQLATYTSKVSSKTDPLKLATSIQLSLTNGFNVELMAMGKEATYIACKAVCIAETFSVKNGQNLLCKPSYITVVGELDGLQRSAMSWMLWTE